MFILVFIIPASVFSGNPHAAISERVINVKETGMSCVLRVSGCCNE